MTSSDKSGRNAKEQKPESAGLWFFVGIVSTVVLLDQATKQVVLRTMDLYESIPVINGLFNLTHIHNPGGAFGFMASGDLRLRNFLFLGVSIFALLMIVFFYKKTPGSYRFLAGSLSMIFGGAVGNIIDRIRLGEVIDFLDLYIGNYHWPAFNVADSAITIGITIFIVHILFKKMPE